MCSLVVKEQLDKSEAERGVQRKAFQSEIAELQANFKAEVEVSRIFGCSTIILNKESMQNGIWYYLVLLFK